VCTAIKSEFLDFKRYLLRYSTYLHHIYVEHFDIISNADIHPVKTVKAKSLQFVHTAMYVLCHTCVHVENVEKEIDNIPFLCISSRNELFSVLIPLILQDVKKFWARSRQSSNTAVFSEFIQHGPISILLDLLQNNVDLFMSKFVQVQIICRTLLDKSLSKLIFLEACDNTQHDSDPSNLYMYFPKYLASLFQTCTWTKFLVEINNPNNTIRSHNLTYDIYLPSSLFPLSPVQVESVDMQDDENEIF
jgi:hypothetical protein